MGAQRLFFVLACAVLVAMALSPVVKAAEADYVGHNTCKMCHKADTGDQWKKWSGMQHAKAFETLLGDEAKAVAEKAGLTKPPSESPECLKCHVTAYKVDVKEGEEPLPKKIVAKDGVQCESCHSPASLHQKDGMKYKKDPKIDLSVNMTRPDEKVCLKCHNDKSPTWNPEKYTLEDGKKVGFDYEQAWKKINHENPNKKKAE